MNGADPDFGSDKRQYDRFVVHKRVEISTSTKTYDGVLRDISVGGAAIKVRAPLYKTHTVSVDINDLGAFDGRILRAIDDDMVAVEFDVSEQQSIELAAKLVGIYYGAGAEGPHETQEVEKVDITP
jgi:hypothetical protein